MATGNLKPVNKEIIEGLISKFRNENYNSEDLEVFKKMLLEYGVPELFLDKAVEQDNIGSYDEFLEITEKYKSEKRKENVSLFIGAIGLAALGVAFLKIFSEKK